jgi:hypothetical protein
VSRYDRGKASFRTSLLVALVVVCESNAAIAQPVTPTLQLSSRELFARTFARLGSYAIPPYAIFTTRWHIQAYSALQPPVYYVPWRYAIRTSDRDNSSSTGAGRRDIARSELKPQNDRCRGRKPRELPNRFR